ncbi:MAG: cell division protein FtsZ [Chitinophagia bacterium]|nr:cell division protein FtsZ [Chitinophagia bacterium]
MIKLDIPKNDPTIIKVVGVGGGGGNAVNHMYNSGMKGVDFIICNTDLQALQASPVTQKIQLGPNETEGLGAGATPEVGRKATEESIDEIRNLLKENTKMAFITAGMGGGTGTGGAPVIAAVCRELKLLTVAIVTTPLMFEGRRRMNNALKGIEELKQYVDSIIIISNDKLMEQTPNLKFTDAYAKANEVLATATRCITDIINRTGIQNRDFADVKKIMTDGGVAIFGVATAEGEKRALRAIEEALYSPLLNDNDISGAKWLLITINSGSGETQHTMQELYEIQAYAQQCAGDDCDILIGQGIDDNLGDKISVSLIATGFPSKGVEYKKAAEKESPPPPPKVYVDLNGPVATKAEISPIANTIVSSSEPSIDSATKPSITASVAVNSTEPYIPVPEAKPTPINSEPANEMLNINVVVAEPVPAPLPASPESTIVNTIPAPPAYTPPSAPQKTQEELEHERAVQNQNERIKMMLEKLKLGATNAVEAEPAFNRQNKSFDVQPHSSDDITQNSNVTIGVDRNDSPMLGTLDKLNKYGDNDYINKNRSVD